MKICKFCEYFFTISTKTQILHINLRILPFFEFSVVWFTSSFFSYAKHMIELAHQQSKRMYT